MNLAPLKDKLQEIYDQHEPDLSAYVWVSEADRWAELAFCLLNQLTDLEPEQVRMIVNRLQDLGVLRIVALAGDGPEYQETRTVLAYVLKRYGFSDQDAERGVQLLTHVAQHVQRDYAGKIQGFLRRHAKMMRDELLETLKDPALGDRELRYAITLWLQNAVSLPISLESSAVVKFCQDNEAAPEDLWKAADGLDLNLALVDDLIEMRQNAQDLAVTGAQEGDK